MFSKMCSWLVAAGLVFGLQVSGAIAGPVVSGTTASGYAGQTSLNPTLSVAFDGTDIDASAIAAWDFKLYWDASALSLNIANSKMQIGTNTHTWTEFTGNTLPPTVTETVGGTGDGFYTLSWVPKDVLATVDLSGGITFTAAFDINAGAAPGFYGITFGDSTAASPFSALIDAEVTEYTYDSVTSGQGAMGVRVLAANPTQVPEPGSLGLLALALLGVARVCTKRQAGRASA